jgi:hypothetical protein
MHSNVQGLGLRLHEPKVSLLYQLHHGRSGLVLMKTNPFEIEFLTFSEAMC